MQNIEDIIRKSINNPNLNEDFSHLYPYYFPGSRPTKMDIPSEIIGMFRIKTFISNYFPNIGGLDILDLGCGSHLDESIEVYKGEGFSILAHMLHSEGARVVGVDVNINPEKVPFEAYRTNVRNIGEIIKSQFHVVICNRVLGLPFSKTEKRDSEECEIEIIESIYERTKEKGIFIISAQEFSQERWECLENKVKIAGFEYLARADELVPNCKCSIFIKE